MGWYWMSFLRNILPRVSLGRIEVRSGSVVLRRRGKPQLSAQVTTQGNFRRGILGVRAIPRWFKAFVRIQHGGFAALKGGGKKKKKKERKEKERARARERAVCGQRLRTGLSSF